MTQFDTLAKAKELGFEAIEFTDIDRKEDYALQTENARKLRLEADRLGMEINAYTIGGCLFQEKQESMDAEVERLERLFNAVAHDNYGLLVDMGNFLCVDEDPIHAVSRVAPYAFHVHIKDMRIKNTSIGSMMTRGGNYLKGTVVGKGDVPVKQCLQILKRIGYEGYVYLEYEGAEDCIAGITRSLANIRQMLSALS